MRHGHYGASCELAKYNQGDQTWGVFYLLLIGGHKMVGADENSVLFLPLALSPAFVSFLSHRCLGPNLLDFRPGFHAFSLTQVPIVRMDGAGSAQVAGRWGSKPPCGNGS